MTNSKTLFRELVIQIQPTAFERDEAEAIIYRLLESKCGLSRKDILMGKETEMSPGKFDDLINRINNHEPIQYIINEEEFYGRIFYVDSSVLIPRPETEELVRHCISHLLPKQRKLKILDIGTGSGCIPITLALEVPDSEVFATDISESALQVARRNARSLNATTNFFKHDILKEELPFGDFDLIISNPPYISEKEKTTMLKNVLDFEPHSALFTGDNDPLIFYKAIVRQGEKLKKGGIVAVEINEHFGKETADLFIEDFSEVKIIKDINQKERFITAIKK